MNICFNGEFLPTDAPLFTAQNRSFKWGDGLFETMKVAQGKLLLKEFHFERLFISMQLLQIEKGPHVEQERIAQAILNLCEINKCSECARIRLAVYRQEDNEAGYVIEAIPLHPQINSWQQQGVSLTLYPFARKSTDAFANIKSANYMPYVLASKYAAQKGSDDALVLNIHNRICDSSKANLFLIKNSQVYTPSLHEGCINGVMRRLVMEKIKKSGYRLHHDEITENQLLQADEVFLTNAIQIIRWVKSYKQQQYSFGLTKEIFEAVRATIFS